MTKHGTIQQRRSCGIREAKTTLSTLLREVQKGAEIVITDRGRPVGKLIPVSTQELSLQERLRALERIHWIEPAAELQNVKLPPPIPLPLNIAQRLLQEDRSE